MADKLTLEVAAPDRLLVQAEVDHVQAPAADGSMGVLPGHAPLLTSLREGVLTYTQDGADSYLAIHRGFMEVQPDRVRVLADRAESANEIDVERARKALARARDLLEDHSMEIEADEAAAAAARAQARLKAWELESGA